MRPSRVELSHMKTATELEAELSLARTWSDSNPMKAVLISLAERDLYRLRNEERKAQRRAAAEKAAAEKLSLPWYKRIFA